MDKRKNVAEPCGGGDPPIILIGTFPITKTAPPTPLGPPEWWSELSGG